MRHLLAGVVTAGVVGCAGAAPMQPPQPKAEPTGVLHGIPGETMLYQVQLRGLPVARVEVAAGSLGLIDGHRAVIVHSHGHSDGLLSIVTDLTYDLETRLDLDTGRPLDDIEEIRIKEVDDDDHERTPHAFDDEQDEDMHSAAARVRGWRSKPNERLEFELRIAGFRLLVALWESGRETIAAPKQMPAMRYTGLVANKYHFTVWLSDDIARVPLRLRTESRWGAIAVDLVDYQNNTTD